MLISRNAHVCKRRERSIGDACMSDGEATGVGASLERLRRVSPEWDLYAARAATMSELARSSIQAITSAPKLSKERFEAADAAEQRAHVALQWLDEHACPDRELGRMLNRLTRAELALAAKLKSDIPSDRAMSVIWYRHLQDLGSEYTASTKGFAHRVWELAASLPEDGVRPR